LSLRASRNTYLACEIEQINALAAFPCLASGGKTKLCLGRPAGGPASRGEIFNQNAA
jgi:hypothetical protein